MRNSVVINLGKEEITIKIADKATHEESIASLKRKLPELKKLYKEEKTPILVTGKVLKNKEVEEIRDMIKSSLKVKVNFDTPKELGLHGIKRTFAEKVEISETKFHRGSLRSGNKIEYEGSLVIIGDVNAGAEVIAGDNVVVLGILRGVAHAGAKGNKQAIIAAAEIEAPQIRIANIVKEIEDIDIEEHGRTYAYVSEEEIILE